MVYLQSFAAVEGMDTLPGVEGITVAVNAADEPVGFIRLQKGADGVAHINPVVTYATWRGYGVGRALVEDALVHEGELRLVARGYSIPFYEKLGFEEISWDDIAPEVAAECDGCEIREECGPLPMCLIRADATNE